MFTSASKPVSVVTEPAFTTPMVLPFTVFSTVAARLVSLSVTASLPRPVIVPAVPAV